MPDCGHICSAARRELPSCVLEGELGARHCTAEWQSGADFGKLHVHG